MLHPVRLLPTAFLVTILIGGAVLMLPACRADPSAPFVLPALFTAVSAVCVTGLTTVDTATYWTPLGQGVILALIQIGGFGIMSLATTLALLVNTRLGFRSRRAAQTETHTMHLGDVTHVVRRVALIMLSCELVVAVLVTVRFRVGYDDDWSTALWHGVFHAVSAFNNAGFSIFSDNIIGFVADPWMIIPLCMAVVVGGIGFPVITELLRAAGRPETWSVHTRITVYGTALLLLFGFLSFAAFEWSNENTIGGLGVGGKLLASLTGTVMPRTAGFNSIDYGVAAEETHAFTIVLMFIGGGSAGTAGGVKVTTFFLLAFVIWAEVRGDPDVTVGPRAITNRTQREALSVALLGVALVAIGTLALLVITDFHLDDTLFEATSAFATVGLTTGITFDLPYPAQVVIMVLMFVGRVGTITVASALALRSRPRMYRLPEERPVVG